jgi:glycosyltransferase involved in cell wall biosynthesis
VLLVLHEEQLGGASRAALRALEPLVDAGLDLHVWCARPSELFDELNARGMQVAGAPRPLRYSLRTLREPPGVVRRIAGVPGSLRAFGRHLRQVDPDLVHVNSTLSLPEGAVAKRAGYPVFFHFHDGRWPGVKGELVRRAAWKIGDEVAALSRSNAEALDHRGRSPRLLPSPAAIPEAPFSKRREPGSPIVVASVGVLGTRKGTDVYLDAVERLAGTEPPLEFHLIGGAEDAPSPEWAAAAVDRARALGVHYRERADVRAELPGWDIVAAPSREEPFGLVVLEAMGAARAIVGAETGGIAELLADGAGVLIPPGDSDALATAINQLATNAPQRAALGAAAYPRSLGYDVERGAERLSAAYTDTVANCARPRPAKSQAENAGKPSM